MDQPNTRPGARFCIVYRADETVIYTNAAGFLTLADWMVALGNTLPDDMCELHMSWHLNSFVERRSATFDTVWSIDERSKSAESKASHEREVTFMMLPEERLDELRRSATIGPDGAGRSPRQIENTIPVLGVRELERSIAFFKDVLGFEVEWRADSTCSVGRDGCSIMLQIHEEPRPTTIWIGLDGDALFPRIQQSGAMILQLPTNTPWAYEMRIADPDGNILWLGAEPKE